MVCFRLLTHNQSFKFLPCYVIPLGYGYYNSVDVSAEQNAIKDLKETQAWSQGVRGFSS